MLTAGVTTSPLPVVPSAAGFPAAITIASQDMALAARVQSEFGSNALRLYTNEDVIGVELGGALKNVIAIAAGIVSGLELGHNSVAALITRGIAETTRILSDDSYSPRLSRDGKLLAYNVTDDHGVSHI